MRRSALVIAVLAAVMAVPIVGYASHQFTDVPDSNVFHNSIGWMKDNNITVGCNPPANTQYCPNDAVTRGQMSAFMKRLAENKVVDAGKLNGQAPAFYTNPAAVDRTPNVLIDTNAETLAELSITAPASGGIVLDGQLVADVGSTGLASFWFQVDNTTCTFDVGPFYSVAWGVFDQNGSFGSSASAHGAVAAGAGAHTVTLCGHVVSSVSVDATLVAEYVSSVVSTGSLSADGGGDGVLTPSS